MWVVVVNPRRHIGCCLHAFMMFRAALAVLAVSTFALGACASPDDASEDTESSDDALTGNATVGATFTTTARLNLRESPSTEADVLLTMPLGAKVTALEAKPSAGFYHVKYNDQTGWAYGAYLEGAPVKAGTADPPASETPIDDSPQADVSFTGRKFSGVTMLYEGDYDFLMKCDSYSRKNRTVQFYCGDAQSRSFVDNGAWIAMPGSMMTRKMCNQTAKVCKGDKCISARIVEKSETSSRWEGSTAVLEALGVAAGWKSCTSSFGTATGVTVQLAK
jgi:hypothetical protein